MEDFPIEEIDPVVAFPQFSELPQPPKNLSMRGSLSHCHNKKYIAIVGSRAYTSYGAQVCRDLINGLRGYPVVIVSGLAMGIDAIAHKTAIENNLTTIAFPGSGLGWNVLYPSMNKGLAKEILSAGGALLSEYDENFRAAHWSFPQRNRLVAGIADIVIVIEAKEKSGALITARLGTEYNKIVGAVPGPIYSETSKGTNWLLHLGATIIRDSSDILEELGLKHATEAPVLPFTNSNEDRVLLLLTEPRTKDYIIKTLELSPSEANILLSTIEIKGFIKETYGLIERIV